MSEPRHRKLTALGIASLVSTARPEVLQRLSGEIFNMWLDVFGELKESQERAAEYQQQLVYVIYRGVDITISDINLAPSPRHLIISSGSGNWTMSLLHIIEKPKVHRSSVVVKR